MAIYWASDNAPRRHWPVLCIALAIILASIALARAHAQSPFPQPWICNATVDLTTWTPAQQHAYILTGASCPIAGHWTIENAGDSNLLLTGGPR